MQDIASYVSLVPSLLVLIASIQLVSRFPQPESYFLLIGSICSTLTNVFFRFLHRLLPDSQDMSIIQVASAIGTLGYLLFGVGFFLLVRRVITVKAREQKTTNTSSPN